MGFARVGSSPTVVEYFLFLAKDAEIINAGIMVSIVAFQGMFWPVSDFFTCLGLLSTLRRHNFETN